MNEKIQNYTVSRDKNLNTLIEEVKRLVQEHGWQPLGGIAVEQAVDFDGKGKAFYLQALVRDKI